MFIGIYNPVVVAVAITSIATVVVVGVELIGVGDGGAVVSAIGDAVRVCISVALSVIFTTVSAYGGAAVWAVVYGIGNTVIIAVDAVVIVKMTVCNIFFAGKAVLLGISGTGQSA